MARLEHHVVHSPNGGWSVKREGAARASIHTETKSEAMRLGRAMSIRTGSELIIHGMDGQIQHSDSHGHDPCPLKDKK
ncbi:hypothetical protein FACS1894172_19200 [Spirochaetia bacterium]|nr:hypothetical protein FACS1894172_19200 [Spirochaetia bacterium]